MIRPDDVKLSADPNGQGTIVSREFHGSRNFYFVRLDSGATVRSRQPTGKIFETGARVRVAARKSAEIVTFPPGQDDLVPKDIPIHEDI